jgi:uncharacterized membrane protein YfcA
VGVIGFRASVAGSLFIVSAVTFIGFLALVDDMRAAIAASFVVVYFALLFTLVFADVKDLDTDIAEQILGNFTTLVGAVITFYFGATAAERISSIRSPSETEKPPTI